MLPIETLKLMHCKALKRLAAKNMLYRKSWSDKVWDRKYDKKFDLKRHCFILSSMIEKYSIYNLMGRFQYLDHTSIYAYLHKRAVYDMSIKPNAFRFRELKENALISEFETE